jgi:hypothetical protein
VVRIARTFAEVEAIREIWSAWKKHRDSDIDFCLRYVWAGKDFIRPHVIVIYRDGRPDAMLVGRLEHYRVDAKIGYFRLAKVTVRLLSFAHGGLLGNDSLENSEEFIKSILSALRTGAADMAVLHQACADSPIFRKALSVPRRAERDRLTKVAAHHVMKLPKTIDEVYRDLSAGHRSELRRKKKKILVDFDGTAKIRCVRELVDLEEAVAEIEGIAAKSYQRGLGVGFKDTEHTRQRLRLCAEKGWLRIYLLSLDAKPCAFWLGTVYCGTFCSDYLGFDTRLSDYSPGMFLLTEMIDSFCREGIKEIDFGHGEGRYKERFGNSHSMEASVWIYSPTPKGLLANGMRTTSRLIDDALRKILNRTNILPTLKKFWRTHSAEPAGKQ